MRVQFITLYIAAVSIFFTTIQAAPIKHRPTIRQLICRLYNLRKKINLDQVEHEDLYFVKALGPHADRFIHEKVDEIVSQPLQGFCPQMSKELSERPIANYMSKDQMKLARLYNAYVFERLKSLFLNLRDQDIKQSHNDAALRQGLRYCRDILEKHYNLLEIYNGRRWVGRRLRLTFLAEHSIEGAGDVNLDSCMEAIARCRENLKDEMAELNGRTYPFNMAQISRPFLESSHQVESTESTACWPSPLTYSQLKQLPLTDLRFLSVRLEHERLIVDRAQYNQAILLRCLRYQPLKTALVSRRLSEYSRFIEEHKETIRSYEQVLQHGQRVDASTRETVGVNPVPGSPTPTSRMGDTHLLDGPPTKVVDAPYTTPVLLRHPVVGPSVPPRVEDVQYDGLQYGNPAALSSHMFPSIASSHDLSGEFPTISELSDLFASDSGYDDMSISSLEKPITILGVAEERASCSFPERSHAERVQGHRLHFVAPSPTYGRHPESSSYSYNDRISGKRPMDDATLPQRDDGVIHGTFGVTEEGGFQRSQRLRGYDGSTSGE
ncbi:hypothetical protein SeMB42_g03328 [Synchytrium endobioticum]|uniref:Uncharacterized protein n=1 Tax=Synchytrium endobioticum TaxID=286115 RepID=A0A507D8E8_9FUNG|nr:hypothetical protein SeMB42_g03328 [Synchytrium endobioticum]TPX47754.1 hypothetical protein SeLEV6574_g02473 [Synchytrium endobioticum]